jgi:redox-sensing transcriptional repressor
VTTRPRRISDSTVRRLSLYLRTLETLEHEGEVTVSSRVLARRAGTTAAQVRKDLSSFGSFGKRGLGYAVFPLKTRLAQILGLTRRWRVLLVGAGRIGSALFAYPFFRERGFEIVSVVDRDPAKVGTRWNGIEIEPVDDLSRVVRDGRIAMAILAVPGEVAQEVTDALVAAGVQGILNFAPTQLRVPPGVVVNDVNLVMELEALSFALQHGGRGVPDGAGPTPSEPSAGPDGLVGGRGSEGE